MADRDIRSGVRRLFRLPPRTGADASADADGEWLDQFEALDGRRSQLGHQGHAGPVDGRSQRERMLAGEPYDAGDPELVELLYGDLEVPSAARVRHRARVTRGRIGEAEDDDRIAGAGRCRCPGRDTAACRRTRAESRIHRQRRPPLLPIPDAMPCC